MITVKTYVWFKKKTGVRFTRNQDRQSHCYSLSISFIVADRSVHLQFSPTVLPSSLPVPDSDPPHYSFLSDLSSDRKAAVPYCFPTRYSLFQICRSISRTKIFPSSVCHRQVILCILKYHHSRPFFCLPVHAFSIGSLSGAAPSGKRTFSISAKVANQSI